MIRTANDRALQEMRQRLERELEEAKLELLEVKMSHILSLSLSPAAQEIVSFNETISFVAGLKLGGVLGE